MKKGRKGEVPDFDREAYIRLACAIAETRGYEYKKAYYRHLMKPSSGSLGDLKYRERKLKGPITALEDKDIKILQEQVRKHGYPEEPRY